MTRALQDCLLDFAHAFDRSPSVRILTAVAIGLSAVVAVGWMGPVGAI